MTIAVLDYSVAAVDVIHDVPDMASTEEVENYLEETLEYNLDEISYMVGDPVEVRYL